MKNKWANPGPRSKDLEPKEVKELDLSALDGEEMEKAREDIRNEVAKYSEKYIDDLINNCSFEGNILKAYDESDEDFIKRANAKLDKKQPLDLADIETKLDQINDQLVKRIENLESQIDNIDSILNL